jgi:hypothetical protein
MWKLKYKLKDTLNEIQSPREEDKAEECSKFQNNFHF